MGSHRSFRLPLRGADLTELLEQRLLILRRDPDARVRHRDLCRPVRQARAHADPAALGRELHGVREQVQQDLFHLALVRMDLAHSLVDVALQRDGRGVGARERGSIGA